MSTGRTGVDELHRLRRQTRRRVLRVWVLLAAAVLALFAVRVLLGDYQISLPDFFRLLAGQHLTAPGTTGASFILMESKLPRAVAAVLVGVALGVAGAVFQEVLGNPLASPDVLGVSAGASAGAVTALVLAQAGGPVASLSALVGALVVVAILQWFGGGRRATVSRMVLAGVGVAAALSAYIQWVLLRADLHRAQDALVWLSGSLARATWPELGTLAVLVTLVTGTLLLGARRIAMLSLGDDLAASLGLSVRRVRVLALGGAVLLVAGCAAVCGPVLFVALLAGPIARRLHRGRTVLASAGLVGACLVLAADHLGAYGIPGANLPVGVVTGFIGALFLVWLILADARRAGTR